MSFRLRAVFATGGPYALNLVLDEGLTMQFEAVMTVRAYLNDAQSQESNNTGIVRRLNVMPAISVSAAVYVSFSSQREQ